MRRHEKLNLLFMSVLITTVIKAHLSNIFTEIEPRSYSKSHWFPMKYKTRNAYESEHFKISTYMLVPSLVITSVYLQAKHWPNFDLLIMRSMGKRPGIESKNLSRGLTLAVQAKAGAIVCPKSVHTVSTVDWP